MLDELGAGPGWGVLAVTVYAALFGGLLLPASRWGERIGHRRCVVVSVAVFAAGALVAALATTAWLLVAARAVQGAAAAASVPSALALITTHVPEGPRRRRAVAAWSAAGAAAGISGFLASGVLTEFASWRAVPWTMVLVGGALVVAVLRTAPADPASDARSPIPWRSAAVLLGGVAGLVAGPALLTEGGAAPAGLTVTALGAATVAVFAVHERRGRLPLIPVGARRSSAVRRAALVSFVNTAATGSSFTVATIHLQRDLGLTALDTAGLLVGFSVLVIAGSALAPTLVARIGTTRTLTTGLAAIAAGNLVLVALDPPAAVGIAAGICGAGIGISSVAANDLGTSVRADLRAVAAGALNTAAQLGTAIGTAVLVLLATQATPRLAWGAAAALALVTAAGLAVSPFAVGFFAYPPRIGQRRTR